MYLPSLHPEDLILMGNVDTVGGHIGKVNRGYGEGQRDWLDAVCITRGRGGHISILQSPVDQEHICQGWLVCWSLTSLCHSNGHIETMPAREINPFTALTRIRPQFLRTQ